MTGLNSRLHVEDVFDPQAFPQPAPLLAQPLLGPGHVDAFLLAAPGAPGTGGSVRRRVPVMDQLSLKREMSRGDKLCCKDESHEREMMMMMAMMKTILADCEADHEEP